MFVFSMTLKNRHLSDQILANFQAQFPSTIDGVHKMNAAVESGDPRLLSRLLKGFKMPGSEAVQNFYTIRIRKMIPEKPGQDCR
jgi:hypothetical protein